MPLYKELPDGIDAVDVIVAGGGTAGCIIASRLSDADPGMSILVIESGSDNVDNPHVAVPALFLLNLMPGSTTVKFYETRKSPFISDRQLIVPTADVLGGGSSVNMLTYSRAQRCDLDSWDVPGWTSDDLIPYMKKLETYHGPGSKDQHGSDGPIQVSGGTFRSSAAETSFIKAIQLLGWPEVEDLSNLETNNGAQPTQRYISPDGKRQDTASRYLHPRLQDGKHPNLHVVVESRVKNVLLDGMRATGVVYETGQKSETKSARRVIANKMVVLCCGTIGSPAILERSGIGDPDVLANAGIKNPLVNLQGVGAGYEDHHEVSYAYYSSLTPRETLDGLANGTYNIEEMVGHNDPFLGWNCTGVTCKLRPSDSDVSALGPDFESMWKKEFEDNPDKPLSIITQVLAHPTNAMGVPLGQYMGASTITLYPFSRGYLHITGPDLDDPIDFDTGFLADAGDLDIKKSRWAYKQQREIIRRMDSFRGEMADYHPRFPDSSRARCTTVDMPLPEDVANIEYSEEDDAVIDQWIREHVSTTWHSLGTCKMAPREKQGVVDASLGVHGVEALKIADMSIVPKNVGANTANTAMVNGEKAADIFMRELGLTR
ncbi:alcohol oxidase-like protein [Xylariomycetidae sp. FL2044]|nr:alcohol oxidase-like protein [Xylariomycetidae sp. FL2044]